MRIPHSLFLLGIIFLTATLCAGQTPAKEPTASISGHVTIGGKSASGITVVAAMRTSVFDNKTIAKTLTDEDGNYKLPQLPAGRLSVMPLAKAFVVESAGAFRQPGQAVNVTEGEAITKIDFALVRGGVVTGRITDADGHPLIGEVVNVSAVDSKPDTNVRVSMLYGPGNYTDDRGVYRAYGLGPGSYKVSVGQDASAGGAVGIMGMGGSQYVKTFYPGVQEEAKATIIEIKEGTEVANVDIIVGKATSGFSVSGRVIDADTNAPVANLYIGHAAVDASTQQLVGMNMTGNQTDALGKFRLEGLQPGRYAVFTLGMGQNNSTYSEPEPFEITGSDVTGIEIKVRRGATISGIAVLENNSDPSVASLLQSVSVTASVQAKGMGAPSYAQARVGADGSFRLAGLAPGKARLFIQGFPAPPKGLTLVRTELEGLEQSQRIEVTAGANITGVRMVFAYGTGTIRGEVRVEGGELPEGTTLAVSLRSAAGDGRRFNRGLELDNRFHFLGENIPPGNYEVYVRAVNKDFKEAAGFPPVKQNVTVTNGAEVQVTLVVDLAKLGGQP